VFGLGIASRTLRGRLDEDPVRAAVAAKISPQRGFWRVLSTANVPILFALPSLQSAFYRDYTGCTSYGRIKRAPVWPIASDKRLA
jgi:hypothetical protein